MHTSLPLTLILRRRLPQLDGVALGIVDAGEVADLVLLLLRDIDPGRAQLGEQRGQIPHAQTDQGEIAVEFDGQFYRITSYDPEPGGQP